MGTGRHRDRRRAGRRPALEHAGRRRRNVEADANWNRYVESERQRHNMRQELETARQRTATLEAERDTAAYQLTQLAAVATVATQQAQAGRGFILNEGVLDRICCN